MFSVSGLVGAHRRRGGGQRKVLANGLQLRPVGLGITKIHEALIAGVNVQDPPGMFDRTSILDLSRQFHKFPH